MSPAPLVNPLVVHVDVTDTVATKWRAGIQRVVCKLVAHLDTDPRLEVVPVIWLDSVRSFRRLTEDEHRRLTHEVRRPPETEAAAPETAVPGIGGRLRPALGRVRRGLVGLSGALRLEGPLRSGRAAVRRRTSDRALVPLSLTMAPGSVLLELDTVWNNTLVDRGELYGQLRARGVHVAVMVYDLLPQTDPDWFEPSMVEVSNRTLAAQARCAELLFAISAHTASTFMEWAGRLDITPPEPVVVELGGDGAVRSHSGAGAHLPAGLENRTFLLVVGTVEPRKNHQLALRVFDQLAARWPGLSLVIVGREGWRNDEVIHQLRAHPQSNARVQWLRACGDDELDCVYDAAHLVLVPSRTEGYGLPVVEALAHGIPVVASNGGALPEVAPGLAQHLDPDDVDGWVAAVERHLEDPEFHRARRDAAQRYRPRRWADTAGQVVEELAGRWGPMG